MNHHNTKSHSKTSAKTPSSPTHLDSRGRARMVDVGGKTPSRRTAIAAGRIYMSEEAFALAREDGGGQAPKGDVFAVARVAAISAAKRTAEWIPLCHILPLESVRVSFKTDETKRAVICEATVAATAKTGVEMEALVAVQAGLLTIYDMLKAVDKSMRITDVRLLEKHGGKSGSFMRDKFPEKYGGKSGSFTRDKFPEKHGGKGGSFARDKFPEKHGGKGGSFTRDKPRWTKPRQPREHREPRDNRTKPESRRPGGDS